MLLGPWLGGEYKARYNLGLCGIRRGDSIS